MVSAIARAIENKILFWTQSFLLRLKKKNLVKSYKGMFKFLSSKIHQLSMDTNEVF